MALLEQTASPDQIDPADFDAIYFTGGHAVMWDFPDNPGLQRLTREIWEAGKVVSSVCHGYCGLLNTRLSDGRLLVEGRRLTGFSWREEVLAGVARHMPYNAEAEMTARGARYTKALLPFVSYSEETIRMIGRGCVKTRLRPDIIIQSGDETLAIFDAKWKRLDLWEPNSGVSSGDAYQMNAYASRYCCKRLALIYPAYGDCPPGRITEFALITKERPTLEIIAVDVRELAHGHGIPVGMERAIPKECS